MTFERLLSPLQVGPRLIRNRVLSTAHVPGIESGGLPGDDYIAYQRARARGGAGMQISGSATIHRTGAVGQGRSLDNTRPGIVEAYGRLAEAIHGEGGTFLIQLGHAAGTVNDTDVGRPLLAPSAVQSTLIRETPRAMSLAEIAAPPDEAEACDLDIAVNPPSIGSPWCRWYDALSLIVSDRLNTDAAPLGRNPDGMHGISP